LEADIQLNPVTAIEFYAQKNRRPMLALEDLPAWAADVGKMGNVNRRCFWFLCLFTGLRRTDCASIKVADIRWDDGVLHRPAPKGGPKRAFDVPLSEQVKAILREALEARRLIVSDSDWLFPATRGTGAYTGANVDEVMGIGCHALRRTFASACIQVGVEVVYVKSLMNHTTTGDLLMNSYVTLSPVKRLEAMQRVSDFIETNLMGLSAGPVKALTWQGERAAGGLAA
jgi:integrase